MREDTTTATSRLQSRWTELAGITVLNVAEERRRRGGGGGRAFDTKRAFVMFPFMTSRTEIHDQLLKPNRGDSGQINLCGLLTPYKLPALAELKEIAYE